MGEAIWLSPKGEVYVELYTDRGEVEASCLWNGRDAVVSASSRWDVEELLRGVAVACDAATLRAWIAHLGPRQESIRHAEEAAERFVRRVKPLVRFGTPCRPAQARELPLHDLEALYDRLCEIEAVEEAAPEETSASPGNRDLYSFVADRVETIVSDLRDGYHVLMVGPTGTGKNTAAEAVFRALGWHVETIEGKESLDDLYFCGAIVPQEGGALRWVDGPLARAMRRAAQEPVLLWFNEINRCQRKHLNILISALDTKPAMLFRDLSGIARSPSGRYCSLEIPQTGELLIAPAEHFHVLAACNLGSQYAVSELDPALERRFGTVVEFDYLDPEREALLLRTAVPSLPVPLARAMASLAAQVRLQWRNAECAAPLDTGRLIVWARKVAREMPPTAESVIRLARTTWLPVVAGRDHTGLIDEGAARGLEELVRDLVGGAI